MIGIVGMAYFQTLLHFTCILYQPGSEAAKSLNATRHIESGFPAGITFS